jgi:zinc-binding alcohol dehydrogenase family protein
MKAVGYRQSLPISDPDSLIDFIAPDPVPAGRDLLIEVKAVAVNPVDGKVRLRAQPPEGQTAILGWDATGIVKVAGPDCRLFQAGDEVWYAGDVTRPGCNSELHLVDERIVGRKPASLSFAQAAALPLTSITAWELLFERLRIPPGKHPLGQSLLIIGAAGGVGSILTQIASRLTALTVIGTAARPESRDWVLQNGAHHVIDHTQPLAAELRRLGIPQVTHVAALTQTDRHWEQIVESLAPQGHLCLIDDPPALDVKLLKKKSIALHWELMFTRSMFQTPDMIAQHHLLNEVSALVDAGILRSTFADHYGTICAENLKRAQALIESGRSRGKIVLEGF